MKNFLRKAGFLFLLLCAGIASKAQIGKYNALSQELHLLQKQLVPDQRVAILNFELRDTLKPILVLFGETDLPDAKLQITQFLNDKKVPFIDSLRLLPDAILGDKIWALATLSVSNLRVLPKDASELASQVMMGTPLKVLDYIDKWYRVQTPENYIGWMDTSGLKTFTSDEMDRWRNSERYVYNVNSGFAYEKGEVVTDLVLGDLFEVVSEKQGFLLMKTPDDRRAYVPKADCMSFDTWNNLKPNVDIIISISKQQMGSPYLWGGTSTKLTDCSGFVKLAYYSQGIILARDASQQALYGDSIDFSNADKFLPGDLLFFGETPQKIRHVGIYLNNGEYIHSSGKVHISSILPNDPKYNPHRTIMSVRRILNSVNTEGIVRVKDHPWYAVQTQKAE